jgi:cytochrome c peroxidase
MGGSGIEVAPPTPSPPRPGDGSALHAGAVAGMPVAPIACLRTDAAAMLRRLGLLPISLLVSCSTSPGPRAMTGFLHRLGAAWLALLLVAGVAPAGVLGLLSAGPMPASDREPITPVPAPPPADPLKVALGQRLFEDPRLSHDQKRTCASCHDTRWNGADSRPRDRAPDGSELAFNTNTVFNAALSFRLNWEGSYRTLEAQAEASLQNPQIMATSIDEVLGRLRNDKGLVGQFNAAYGHDADRDSFLDAIATYERSLLTPGSRFDRWLGGEAALSTEEWDGYQLFKSLGCISCHQGANVGGNLFERHGIFHPLAAPKPKILRVPSLRNVAITPPYFHDGSAPTLEVAVRRMAKAQLDRKLSHPQIASIVAFLRTLTGTYRGRPVEAPP